MILMINSIAYIEVKLYVKDSFIIVFLFIIYVTVGVNFKL